MKKYIILFLTVFMIISATVFAENWIKTNEILVAWNPVTTLADGSPIPAGDVITYAVFVLERAPDASPILMADGIDTLQIAIPFDQEGFFHIGIMASRQVMVDGVLDPEPMTSAISWSDQVEVCLNGNTFGIRHHIPPGQADGLTGQ